MTPASLQGDLRARGVALRGAPVLLLEAAGTPVGARKRGARTHLPW